MRKRYLFSLFVFVVPFFWHTHTVEAYFTTRQSVVPLDSGASLFLIEYAFGTNRYLIDMPVLATNTPMRTEHSLSYAILDKDDMPVSGKASGIVLSNASMTEGPTYKVPKGATRTFTLIAVFIPEDPEDVRDHRLQVTHLPFLLDALNEQKLNPSELKYYTTPYTD